jgi:hypothetical protein
MIRRIVEISIRVSSFPKYFLMNFAFVVSVNKNVKERKCRFLLFLISKFNTWMKRINLMKDGMFLSRSDNSECVIDETNMIEMKMIHLQTICFELIGKQHSRVFT